MSAASLARQQARLTRHVVPREGQTVEEAARDALLTHHALSAKSAEVLAKAKAFFGTDDLKFARQRGRWFLLIKTINAKGTNSWRELSYGRTPIEAFAMARINAENRQHEIELKKATIPKPEAHGHPDVIPGGFAGIAHEESI